MVAGIARAEDGGQEVIVSGRVQNESSEPQAGLQVTLIRTHKKMSLWRSKRTVSESELGRITTDEHGFYELHAQDHGSRSSYYLRFFDPGSFDSVRYQIPRDEDITQRFRRGRDVVQNLVVQEHPDWRKVAAEIERYGADSPRGQILRQVGLPERVMHPDGPSSASEEWWYYRRGIVYKFTGDRIIGERRFEPVPPPPPLSGSGR
jgi:hypothetical protein